MNPGSDFRRTALLAFVAVLALARCDCGPPVHGATSHLTVETERLDFDSVTLGAEVSATVTLRNDSAVQIDVQKVSISGSGASDFTAADGPRSIEGGGTLELTVTFRPTTPGSHEALLEVENDSDNVPRALVQISGEGRACPAVGCEPVDGGPSDAGDAGAELDGGVDAGGVDAGGDAGTSSSACPTGGAVSVSTGVFTCAQKSGGGVSCWGFDSFGSLGDGPGSAETCSGGNGCRTLPGPVSGLDAGVLQLSHGDKHACVLTTDRHVWCWGHNNSGQLGVVTTASCSGTVCSPVPVEVPGLSDVADVHAGGDNTCARFFDGGVQCWGNNYFHQLASDAGAWTATPTQAQLPFAAVRLDVGGNACATDSDGTLWCWGANEEGQASGQPGAPGSWVPPTPIAGLPAAPTQFRVGMQNACAVSAGDVYCWGDNSSGASSGDAGALTVGVTRVVGLPPGMVAVANSGETTCALAGDRTVWCWGANSFGQLGQGSWTSPPLPAVQVPGLADVVEVSVDGHNVCALQDGGSVYCWGENGQGQIGNGTFGSGGSTDSVYSPTEILNVCE